MKPFTFLKLVLAFFLLARQSRLLVSLATGSYTLGAILGDAVILALLLFSFTYWLSTKNGRAHRDRIVVWLLVLVGASLVQSLYFAFTFTGDTAAVLFRAFSGLRKILPLALLFLFSYLLRIEFARHGELVFRRVLRLLTVFLWVALIYNFAEWALRSTFPSFNAIYMGEYLAGVNNLSVSSHIQTPDVDNDVISKVFRLAAKRVYGLGLDYYVSAGVTFACYLFYACFSPRFKVISPFNAIVFVSLLLSGSRQFILPFVVLNAFFLFLKRVRGRKVLIQRPLLLLVGAAAIWLAYLALVAAFVSEIGYFRLVEVFRAGLVRNWALFLFGKGPEHMTLYSGTVLIEEIRNDVAFQEISNYGWMMVLLEMGVLMTALFVWFHVLVLRAGGGSQGRRPDRYVRGLRLIIVTDLLVGLGHSQVLFDRTMVVFHVLFLSLLYSWAWFRRLSRSAAASPARAKSLTVSFDRPAAAYPLWPARRPDWADSRTRQS